MTMERILMWMLSDDTHDTKGFGCLVRDFYDSYGCCCGHMVVKYNTCKRKDRETGVSVGVDMSKMW